MYQKLNNARMLATAKVLSINPTALTVRKSGSALTAKQEGAKELIMELGLCAIGVALLLLFRTQVGEILKSIMSVANNAITIAFNEVA